MSELGELLKQLRGKRSLREAGKLTGISHNYLSIVERGVDPRSGAPVSPTPETLKKLAESYNYSYEKLMQMAGYIDEVVYKEESAKNNAEEILRYIESGLTNEEIGKRMDFFVDIMKLNEAEVDEFMDFVRWQLSKKTKQQAPSEVERL